MKLDWYFDFISPYPYLQMARFAELPKGVVIQPRPVLFAALLNHWGHKGPAEIPAKARQTYLYTRWLAEQRGVPFVGPPRHPFNPLSVLRLALALECKLDAIQTIYRHIWGEGHDGQSEESMQLLASRLNIDDMPALISDTAVKVQLRTNTETAIERGVYGVPTFAVGDELFWGDDVTEMMFDYLANPALFTGGDYAKLAKIKPAATRI